MAELFSNIVEVQNSNGDILIRLVAKDATRPSSPFDIPQSTAIITIGAEGYPGKIQVNDKDNKAGFSVDAISEITSIVIGSVIDKKGSLTIFEGPLSIRNISGQGIFHVDGVSGSVNIGPAGNEGGLRVRDGKNREVFHVDGNTAAVKIGAKENEGDLSVRDGKNREIFHVDGNAAAVVIGANGNEGDLSVRDGKNRTVFHVDGNTAAVKIGAKENEGDLRVRDGKNREVVHIDGRTALVRIGTTGNEGNLSVRDGQNREVFHVNGNNAVVKIGATGNEGDLLMQDNNGSTTIQLDGQSGDIILNNADFAEDFSIQETVFERITPGTVMILDKNGELTESSHAYDKKVAGVISGAGTYQPGIIMDKKKDMKNRLPLALIGKVYCKVDADFSSIAAGDLLTSSNTPGHAMKASDVNLAFGAVIGKALNGMDEGKGIIPILVNLQ